MWISPDKTLIVRELLVKGRQKLLFFGIDGGRAKYGRRIDFKALAISPDNKIITYNKYGHITIFDIENNEICFFTGHLHPKYVEIYPCDDFFYIDFGIELIKYSYDGVELARIDVINRDEEKDVIDHFKEVLKRPPNEASSKGLVPHIYSDRIFIVDGNNDAVLAIETDTCAVFATFLKGDSFMLMFPGKRWIIRSLPWTVSHPEIVTDVVKKEIETLMLCRELDTPINRLPTEIMYEIFRRL